MSRLEELIQQFCPDGVESKAIGDIARITRGRVMSKDYIKENTGEYPVYSSQTENNGELGKISTYDFDGEYLTWTTDGANAGSLFYRNGKFSITNVCGLIQTDAAIIIPKFAYYALSIVTKSYVNNGMGNPKLMSNVMVKIKIPVPPIEVQAEIVKILDNFTALTTELTTELTARKKQYEFYRDELLSNGYSAQTFALKEVCLSIADGDHMPPPKSDSGIPFITISNITENKQIDFSNVMYVPSEYYEKLADKRKAKNGDILYTVVGSFGTPVHITDCTPFVFQRHIAILRPDHSRVLPRYMFYAMQSTDFYKRADKAATGAAQRTISLAALGCMTIPVPPLEIQERLVNILDRFDTLCNDITNGLPAEIEARQKQYEYYRDKLLTFKELTTNAD